MYPFRNAVTVSHMLLDPYVRRAGVIVDMTCGNGYDTAFLAKLMPAVERTKQRLLEEKLTDRDVRCQCGSHDELLETVPDGIDVMVFNLGYLPSGDHHIHTDYEITLRALKIGLNKIAINGIIIIAAYPGTEAGAQEERALQSFLKDVPQGAFHVSSWKPVNEVHCPPLLYVVQKRGKGHYEKISLHKD